VSTGTIRLLEAAAEILGGEDALAQYLKIHVPLLQAYLKGERELPDFMLLRAVDLVLNDLQPKEAPKSGAAPAAETNKPPQRR
jgi:hypothetical protein